MTGDFGDAELSEFVLEVFKLFEELFFALFSQFVCFNFSLHKGKVYMRKGSLRAGRGESLLAKNTAQLPDAQARHVKAVGNKRKRGKEK